MKILKPALFFACIILIVSSCKKETNPDTNPANTKLQLKSLEYRANDNTLVGSYTFEYDASGRITRILSPESPQAIFATISYNGNEAVFSKPALNPYPGIYSGDTIRFTLDSENRALKRIEYRYLLYDVNYIHNSYTYDTSVYEYDVAGLLTKQTREVRDSSSWISSGLNQITETSRHTISNHQISEGNVVAINEVSVSQPGNETGERNVTFGYTQAYPNKAALSNPAILNEIGIFYDWLPINGYKNIPEQVVSESTDKDSTGNIIHGGGGSSTRVLTFDNNGYLSTYSDSNVNGKWYFKYSN